MGGLVEAPNLMCVGVRSEQTALVMSILFIKLVTLATGRKVTLYLLIVIRLW